MTTDVEVVLRRIGKRCFRNCYETAIRKGEDFTVADLMRCDPTAKTENSKRSRSSAIRRLVREGLAEDALSRCCGPQVPP